MAGPIWGPEEKVQASTRIRVAKKGRAGEVEFTVEKEAWGTDQQSVLQATLDAYRKLEQELME